MSNGPGHSAVQPADRRARDRRPHRGSAWPAGARMTAGKQCSGPGPRGGKVPAHRSRPPWHCGAAGAPGRLRVWRPGRVRTRRAGPVRGRLTCRVRTRRPGRVRGGGPARCGRGAGVRYGCTEAGYVSRASGRLLQVAEGNRLLGGGAVLRGVRVRGAQTECCRPGNVRADRRSAVASLAAVACVRACVRARSPDRVVRELLG